MGILNRIINKLPVELHIPGYQYCGPGIKLQERLARGDPGINPLDKACKEHDIAYRETNLASRHQADRTLLSEALKRIKASNASIGERIAALGVAGAMKGKLAMGAGLKRKTGGGRRKKKRIIKTPKRIGGYGYKKKNRRKVGGFLPLIPLILAGLTAAGTAAGGAASVAKAVNAHREATQALAESVRHNKAMESLMMAKGGGLKRRNTAILPAMKKKLRLSYRKGR